MLPFIHAQSPRPEKKLWSLYVSQVPPLHSISSIHLHSFLFAHAALAASSVAKLSIKSTPQPLPGRYVYSAEIQRFQYGLLRKTYIYISPY